MYVNVMEQIELISIIKYLGGACAFGGDGKCDGTGNTMACNYDQGDCCLEETYCRDCEGDDCICHTTGNSHCANKKELIVCVEMRETFLFQAHVQRILWEMMIATGRTMSKNVTMMEVTAARGRMNCVGIVLLDPVAYVMRLEPNFVQVSKYCSHGTKILQPARSQGLVNLEEMGFVTVTRTTTPATMTMAIAA